MTREHFSQSHGQSPTQREVKLSIEGQEISEQGRQRPEASPRANSGQQQRDPAQADQIMDHLLYSAAKGGDADKFMKELTEKGVPLPVVLGQRSPSRNTLLHAAAESDDIIRAVIGLVPDDLISQANSSRETPLHIAARAGKAGAVELLLPHSNPRATDISGNSALHEAVRNRRYEVIRRLVSEDPNPLYHRNKERKSPWCVAVETGDSEVLKLLLEAPNPVETAVLDSEILKILLEGPNPVITGNSNPVIASDPVYASDTDTTENSDPDTMENSDPDTMENSDLHAFNVTLRKKIPRVFGMSPAHVAVLYRKMGRPYFQALAHSLTFLVTLLPLFILASIGGGKIKIHEQNLDMLIEMWEKKPGLFRLRDARYRNPLHFAAYTNYLDGVKFLIEKLPLSALEQDEDGYLPIHVASMMDHVRIIEELLQKWPDPAEFRTRRGENILHVSARYGCISTVKYVLKIPQFIHLINSRDFKLNTPLHLAAFHWKPSVLLPLARDGRADPKLVNNRNMTALDVVEEDMKEMDAPLRKRLMRIILISVEEPRSGVLAICTRTAGIPRERMRPPKLDRLKEEANTRMIVASLVATMTFASGFSIPGGYNSSDPDAGIAVLLHKTMYNVFVICNSIAMYSSIIAVVILLWTQINDRYPVQSALSISRLPLLVTLATMPVAFMAGVFVSVTKLAWLATVVLVLGSVALFIILSFYLVMYIPLGCKHPLIRRFTDLIIFAGISISGRGTAQGGTSSISLHKSYGAILEYPEYD